jgi:hypothetical protein
LSKDLGVINFTNEEFSLTQVRSGRPWLSDKSVHMKNEEILPETHGGQITNTSCRMKSQ